MMFFTGRMPFLPPNQQHQSTEGKKDIQTTKICHLSPDSYPQQNKSKKNEGEWLSEVQLANGHSNGGRQVGSK